MSMNLKLSSLAILMALTSAVATWNPPLKDVTVDNVLYSQTVTDHRLAEKRFAEAKKLEEAEKTQPQSRNGNQSSVTPIIPPTNSRVLEDINKYRVSLGLNALTEDGTLNASSYNHSVCMAGRCGFNHSSFGWENIAYSCGYRMNVVQEWIASPSHNRVLTGNFSSVGYGEYRVGSCYYFTSQFK